MVNPKAASRYAKSLLDLAAERKELDVCYADMQLAQNAFEQSRELLHVLASPIIESNIKRNILNAMFKNNISNLSQSFLNMVVSKGREVLLPEMVTSFIAQYREKFNIVAAEVISAVALSEKDTNAIKELIKKHTNGEVLLKHSINPELVGGFVLRFDNKQLDMSVQKAFNELRKSLVNKSYEKSL